MFGLLKNRAYAIGVDIGDDNLKLVQLSDNGNGVGLVAGRCEGRPGSIKARTGNWQRWAIETVRDLTANGDFRGRDVIAAIPAGDVYIDHIKMPKTNNGKVEDAIFSKVKQRLPFEPLRDNTMLKYIGTADDNILVMASERKIIDIHLAIYERSGLRIKAIGAWPVALANCYARFFGRRKSDIEAVVMLLDIESNRSNAVICRHKNPLFAHSISIGARQMADEQVVTRLVMELAGCRRQFNTIYRNARVERLIFVSGQAVDKQICASVAKQLEMPAQIGDCLAAVQMADPSQSGIDRRIEAGQEPAEGAGRERVNWATAFGLSLS